MLLDFSYFVLTNPMVPNLAHVFYWVGSQWPGLLIRNLGIPTGGNWLKYLFPNLGFGSPAYSQSGNWFPHEFPQVGFDWNLCSRIWDLVLQLIPKVGIDSHRNSHWKELIEIFESVFFHSSKTGDWLNLISPHWELVENFVPIWDWELIEFNFPTLGIGWNFCSHFWELIQKKNPTSGNWLTFFIPKNGKMGKWDCCKKPWWQYRIFFILKIGLFMDFSAKYRIFFHSFCFQRIWHNSI